MKEKSWKTQGRKVQEWGRGGEARKLHLRISKILKTHYFICLFKWNFKNRDNNLNRSALMGEQYFSKKPWVIKLK